MTSSVGGVKPVGPAVTASVVKEKIFDKAKAKLRIFSKAISASHSAVKTVDEAVLLPVVDALKGAKGAAKIISGPFSVGDALVDLKDIVTKGSTKEKVWSFFNLLTNLDAITDSISSAFEIVSKLRTVAQNLLDWIPIYNIVSFFVGFISIGMDAITAGKSGKLLFRFKKKISQLEELKRLEKFIQDPKKTEDAKSEYIGRLLTSMEKRADTLHKKAEILGGKAKLGEISPELRAVCKEERELRQFRQELEDNKKNLTGQTKVEFPCAFLQARKAQILGEFLGDLQTEGIQPLLKKLMLSKKISKTRSDEIELLDSLINGLGDATKSLQKKVKLIKETSKQLENRIHELEEKEANVGKELLELRGVLLTLEGLKTRLQPPVAGQDVMSSYIKTFDVIKKSLEAGQEAETVEGRINRLATSLIRESAPKALDMEQAQQLVKVLYGRVKLDFGLKVADLVNKIIATVGKVFTTFVLPLAPVGYGILATTGVVSLSMIAGKFFLINKNPFDPESKSRAAKLVERVSRGISHLRTRLESIGQWAKIHHRHASAPAA